MRRILVLSMVFLLLGAAASAADIAGTWKGQFQGGDGSHELTFQFKTVDGRLTGTVAGLRDRELTIDAGKVEGDTVTFSVMTEWQGNPVKLVYKGQVAGSEIRFTMGTEDGGWSTELTAKRAS
jgi:opacity protein-like surface antigen